MRVELGIDTDNGALEKGIIGVNVKRNRLTDLLDPVRDFKHQFLDRLKSETKDTAKLIVALLVIEGLGSMKLFDMDILHDDGRNIAISYLIFEAAAS